MSSLVGCSGRILLTHICSFSTANFSFIHNTPIYFQSIAGDSPLISGVKVIPTILSTSLRTVVSSFLVGRVNHYQTFLFVGAVFKSVTVGSELIYTSGFDTALSPVIGYQILYDVGTGFSVQIPIIVVGATGTASDSAISLSTVLYREPITRSIILDSLTCCHSLPVRLCHLRTWCDGCHFEERHPQQSPCTYGRSSWAQCA